MSRPQELTVLLILCAVILFARKPDAFLRPQFLGEDGALYFAEAHRLGAPALWRTYRGTYWLFQRLVAEAGTYLPTVYEPLWYNVAAFLSTMAVLAYLLAARAELPFRSLLALAVVACPTSGEIFLCLVNSHWVLALLLPLIVTSPETKNGWRTLLDVILVFLTGLSGPLILPVLPLFAARVLGRRTRYSLSLLAAALVCGVLQLAHLQVARSEGRFFLTDPNWLGVWGNGVAGLLFCKWNFVCNCPNRVWLAVVTVILFVAVGLNAAFERDWARLAFLVTALGVLLTTAFAYRHGSGPKVLSQCLGSRYEYLPTVMLIWSIILTRSPRWQPAKYMLLLLIVLASASHFRFGPLANYDWSKACQIVVQNRPGRIPINPPGWFIVYLPR